jgi:shikimate dehydrogenase
VPFRCFANGATWPKTPNTVSSRRQEVWGSPIAHSQSPQLHLAAYQTLGLDWEYRRTEVDTEQLEPAFRSLPAEVGGLSLTMPLKEGILELVSDHRGPVDILHAANTVVRSEDGWWLDNTDWWGVDRVIRNSGGIHHQEAWILGAGATARSVLYALSQHEVTKVVFIVRDPSRARVAQVLAQTLGLNCEVATFDQLPESQPAWVFSTVPGGTVEQPEAFAAFAGASTYLDAAYDPWPTPLASVWLEEGSTILPGLEMLTYQALAQIRGLVMGDTSTPLDREDLVVETMREAVGLSPESVVGE